jgi:hypothetical protein
MAFFIPHNTFLEVAKLHIFRIKILGTLREALSCGLVEEFAKKNQSH